MANDPLPDLPYGGDDDANSGWSGSETSRRRAARRDANGQTMTLQRCLLTLVADSGVYGLTVKEARDLFADTDTHHGSVSGALSNLHAKRHVARLSQERDGCQIYVLPMWVGGRPTIAQGHRR